MDFLRVFDVLTGFLKFLDGMFLQGRVFDDVQYGDEAAPNVGSRKTLPSAMATKRASSGDVAVESPSFRNAGQSHGSGDRTRGSPGSFRRLRPGRMEPRDRQGRRHAHQCLDA